MHSRSFKLVTSAISPTSAIDPTSSGQANSACPISPAAADITARISTRKRI